MSGFLVISAPKLANAAQKIELAVIPSIGLAEARQKRDESNALIRQGLDTFEYLAQKALEKSEKSETLQSFTYKWAEWKLSKRRLKPKTMEKCLQRLEKHLFPRFSGYTLEDFNIADAIRRLEPLEEVMPDMLSRIAVNLIEIWDCAVLCGRIAYNPVAPIKKAFATAKVTHPPTIKPSELAEFFHTLQKSSRSPQIKHLIEWQVLTILRLFESIAVQWRDLDWENKILTIPAERMKGGQRARSLATATPLRQLTVSKLKTPTKNSW